MDAGTLRRFKVAFDMPQETKGAGGVVSVIWSELRVCHAQIIYARGSEVVEAARLEGRSIYKIRIRSNVSSKLITTEARMRDVKRHPDPSALAGVGVFAVLEVDALTDRQWIYLVVEEGKAA